MKKLCSAVLAAALALLALIPQASAVNSKAPYLAFDLDLPLKSRTAASDYVSDVSSEINSVGGNGSGLNFLLSCDGASGLISVAAEDGLVESGMFPSSGDSKSLFEFFTKTNGFKSRSLSSYSICGGNGSPESGDFIFFKDRSGDICSCGLVTGCNDYIINVAVFGRDGNASMYRISRGYIKSYGLGSSVIVSPEYPRYSDLIYLYLCTEFGYSHYGACAVLCNMYCESVCDPRSEERNGTNYGGGFGLCQWSFTRRQELEDFCELNGLSRHSVYSQLKWLREEIRRDYTALNGELLDAYDEEAMYKCAADWCLKYEKPFDKENEAQSRADFCREKFGTPDE